ncbi:hypothetical protein JCM11641_001411 [Rhodosporidiobolus odoratus]
MPITAAPSHTKVLKAFIRSPMPLIAESVNSSVPSPAKAVSFAQLADRVGEGEKQGQWKDKMALITDAASGIREIGRGTSPKLS